jgi:hypothetical protein
MDAQEFKQNAINQENTLDTPNQAVSAPDATVEPAEVKTSRHEEILEQYNTCCICGSDLFFNHRLDYALHSIAEESHCPTCGIRNRESQHIIH